MADILAVELEQVERPHERLLLARTAAQQVERGDAPSIGDDYLAGSGTERACSAAVAAMIAG